MMTSRAPSGMALRQLRKDRARLVVVPLLEHAVQQIEIGFDGNLGEDIAGNELDALDGPEKRQEGLRHVRPCAAGRTARRRGR